MKKFFLSITIFLAGIIANAQQATINDPNAEPRTISGSFNAIKISGGIDLYLSQYSTESVAVSATSEKYREHIKTVVENNVLKIFYDGGNSWPSGNKKLKVYVSFKDLELLDVTGACDVEVAGTITVPALNLTM